MPNAKSEAACALLKDALGIDPMLDGNMLKMLRAVERAHGIGHNAGGNATERSEGRVDHNVGRLTPGEE